MISHYNNNCCSLDLEQWINEPPSESEGEKFDDIDFLMEDEKKQ